jgi:hypothetical protein
MNHAVLLVCTMMLATGIAGANDGKGKADNGNNINAVEVRLRTQLAGGAIAGQKPEGNADFRMESAKNRTRLNVEVEHVNLPQGTVLSVAVMHGTASTMIGTITLNAFGGGELELNSEDGAAVPAIMAGDIVTVSNGAAAILTGAFGN